MTLIGVDLDNTIICYDELFHRLAREHGLIPRDLPVDKTAVRDHLRAIGREDDWTALQGEAYGPRIIEAQPFPGARDFFTRCRELNQPVCIISHKTRRPYRGPDCDLHQAALAWLRHHRFLDDEATCIDESAIHLNETKKAKLDRIAALRCITFIDDLPEFLQEPCFPSRTRRVLFDPTGGKPCPPEIERCDTWDAITNLLLHARCTTP